MAKQKWSDLAPAERRLIVVAGSIQVALAVSAWIDLFRRPAGQVNGSKPLWAAAIAVNTIGPLSYFRWGRRRSGAAA
ncbi:MAG TPA: PLDc N-terminal domain-containing protein [Pseudonocardiaceae bacterium]|nr:PLDc N-terminal domain-containing protein [Pseudonocardiaceae bacterium]